VGRNLIQLQPSQLLVLLKKSNPTATKSTGSFPFFKKSDGKKSIPTPTKSSAISTAKATESHNLESKTTETTTTELNDTKLKKSSAISTAKATESLNLEIKATETKTTESNHTKSKKSTAGSIIMKTPSKKRVTKKESSTASRKKIKIDDATSVNVEATVVKDTSESIFQFTADQTPLQKLHQILNDSRVSPGNPK